VAARLNPNVPPAKMNRNRVFMTDTFSGDIPLDHPNGGLSANNIESRKSNHVSIL
jgi:hypothetical protein